MREESENENGEKVLLRIEVYRRPAEQGFGLSLGSRASADNIRNLEEAVAVIHAAQSSVQSFFSQVIGVDNDGNDPRRNDGPFGPEVA